MNKANPRDRGAAGVGSIGHNLRKTVALVAALSLALAPAAWANRTPLKPGWNMFSPQQDVEVGQQVSKDAEKQLPMLNNSRVDNYVNNLGRKLAAKAPGEKYPYQFKVVNDRAINAFALPGGPIYINRGVIEAADNESQLAGVVAHEISHVALRHGTNQASKASAAQVPLAILGGLLGSNSTGAMLAQLGAGFAVNSVLLKYSRTAESQADTMGTQILYDSAYDPRAIAQFFEKIEAQQKGSGPVEFFSNHPSPDNRIERVNQEVTALGGVRRDSSTNSREFDEIKRYLQSLPAPKGQPLQTGGQSSTPELLILSASYGADNRFIDVRQRMQSRVQDGRLDLKVNNSSMGGDPISQSKTLQMRYQWGNRTYDVIVPENQRISIPTEQQISDTTPGGPSERFVSVENSLLRIDHPDNWQAYGQGDAMTITPRGGLVNDGNGNQALALGVIINIFEPHGDGNQYTQRLQGPGYEQQGSNNSHTSLEQATDRLIVELRLSNRNMRVTQDHDHFQLNGQPVESTYLSNDSPAGGGRETNWMITLQRPEGLLFIVFVAPEREFQNYENTFQRMLNSVRVNP